MCFINICTSLFDEIQFIQLNKFIQYKNIFENKTLILFNIFSILILSVHFYLMSLNNDIQYNNTILKVSNAIRNADYILVGGASGMSAAGGPNWYNDNDEIYLKNFQDIENKYHAGSIWKNLYLEEYTHQHWKSREDWWGFLITLMHFINHEEVYQPYKDLKEILEGKEYDIVTTNQDGQFVKFIIYVIGVLFHLEENLLLGNQVLKIRALEHMLRLL